MKNELKEEKNITKTIIKKKKKPNIPIKSVLH